MGVLRVTHRQPLASLSLADSGSPTPPSGMQEYLERLLKMIPSEVVALYLMGAGFLPSGSLAFAIGWSGVCLIAVIVVRAVGSKDKKTGAGPQWANVGLSAISFLIWLYTIGGPFRLWKGYQASYGSLAVLVWTFFLPYIYKGDAEPAA